MKSKTNAHHAIWQRYQNIIIVLCALLIFTALNSSADIELYVSIVSAIVLALIIFSVKSYLLHARARSRKR